LEEVNLKDKKSLMRAIIILSIVLFFIVSSGQVTALESSGGKWVLVNTTVNPKNAPTEFYGGGQTPGFYTDKRYEGRIAEYTVAETSMSYRDHRMERGEILYFDITLKADFDKPPAVLIPGETVNLSATVSGSGSGSDNIGGGGMSLRFLYTADGRFLEGFEQSLVIHGSVDGPGNTSSRSGSFVVPNPSFGKEVKITAGLMNCPACQVEWIYKADVAETAETTTTSTSKTSTTSTTKTPFQAICRENRKFEYFSQYELIKDDENTKAQIDNFARNCTDSGGIYSEWRNNCRYCVCDRVRTKDGLCIHPDDKRPLDEIFNLPRIEIDPEDLGGKVWGEGFLWRTEGEIFIYQTRNGRGRWVIARRDMTTLFAGDVIYTTSYGIGEIQLGDPRNRLVISENTRLQVPGPKREQTWLDWGRILIEMIKRLGENESFDVAGGHSISGIKGTVFILEVDKETRIATYTVNEGTVEVWLKDDPSTKREVGSGESVRVTETSIEDNPYDWDALLAESGWTDSDALKPSEIEPFDPSDSNDVDSPGTPTLYDEDRGESEDINWGGVLLVLIIIVAAVLGYKKMRKN
jgi:hypothetical protein